MPPVAIMIGLVHAYAALEHYDSIPFFFMYYNSSLVMREVRFSLNMVPPQLPQKGIQIINYRPDVVGIPAGHR